MATVALGSSLDLRKLVTTGSILQISEDFNSECHIESEKFNRQITDIIGEPIQSFKSFESQLTAVDEQGHVKKRILEEGGGLPLQKGCTVSVAYSGYWEEELEPFDFTKADKPLVVNLQEPGLLPGLQIAINSMLVGEMAVFLLSYKVMYGELGIPPRIKPKGDCVFYIRLIKSILTPKDGHIDFSEPNMFERVQKEVRMLYTSGVTLHKTKNFMGAIQFFRKAVSMLHRCRMADEKDEQIQEQLLVKLYMNLAVCCNKTKQPLKACIACNELNRLNSLWNNGKALFQNAKALRMIGQFADAEKKLNKANKLCPGNNEIEAELFMLKRAKGACSQTKLLEKSSESSLNNDFKIEVINLIKNFKENGDLCKLTLPVGLNTAEIEYIKEICRQEDLFCNKVKKNYLLDKDSDVPTENESDLMYC